MLAIGGWGRYHHRNRGADYRLGKPDAKEWRIEVGDSFRKDTNASNHPANFFSIFAEQVTPVRF